MPLAALHQPREKSQRALSLTEKVIDLNSANYTAWEYRWECLEAVGCSKDSESAFMQRIADSNPKNYQLWNHRRRCAFKWGEQHARQELDFASRCLMADAKNYHAWSHRQAVVSRFGLWQEELECVTALVEEDVRNNSAWNQRFFIVSSALDRGPWTEVFEREVDYAVEQIARCPHNESAWNYLRGLCSLEGQQAQLAHNSKLPRICQQVLGCLGRAQYATCSLRKPKQPIKHRSKRELRVHSAAPVYTLAAAEGLRRALQPQADLFNSWNLPDWLVHWGHPGNMLVVLAAMGLYGCGYLGWQIRSSDDDEAVMKAKDLHPKLAVGMTVFFALGALGGILSLIMQDKPIFSSPHVWTGLSGLTLLGLQGMLSLFFDDDPSLRSTHAFLGTGILGLFVVHAALGLQLGLSI
ncbi:hypothetical protein WJX72_010969 [[Myrmecia] bisecta]|uniref:Uncharacterized protein n=1 Tax=[Myrmecia] bisecta TaxID=41462 RepID=A0AAW1PLZ3_9CHLO